MTIDLIYELRTARYTHAQIAAELNRRGLRNSRNRPFTATAVETASRRRGIARPQGIPEGDWEWAKKALAEGVPASWVAETIGVNPKRITKRWQDVRPPDYKRPDFWPQIRYQPELRALHDEFAPKH